MKLRKVFQTNKDLITLTVNNPLISEGIIYTNFYEELQKNNWAELIEDDTKDLTRLVKVITSPQG
ncbi:MAG: hypothetical protein GY755_18830 [Chloroflexi bacterium]|nr:hypothetical protein [Chloroflexota bacterium]